MRIQDRENQDLIGFGIKAVGPALNKLELEYPLYRGVLI